MTEKELQERITKVKVREAHRSGFSEGRKDAYLEIYEMLESVENRVRNYALYAEVKNDIWEKMSTITE